MYLVPDYHCAHVLVLAWSTAVSLLPGEGHVVREEDRAQDGDGRNGRTEIASMKRESGMYGRLNIVCGSVIGTLKRDRDSYTFNKKSFKFGQKVSECYFWCHIFAQ